MADAHMIRDQILNVLLASRDTVCVYDYPGIPLLFLPRVSDGQSVNPRHLFSSDVPQHH